MAGKGGKPKGKYLTVTSDAIKAAIYQYRGNLSSVARAVKISRQAVHKRIDDEAELKEAAAEAREMGIDLAEEKIWKAVERGEPWACKLVVGRLGRNRGWGQKVEINGTLSNTGVVHILELPDNGRKRDKGSTDSA